MARSKKDSTDKTPKRARNGATLGFEEKLWQAADKLRGYMEAVKRETLKSALSSYQNPQRPPTR